MRYLNYWDNKNFWGAKSGPLTHAWAVKLILLFHKSNKSYRNTITNIYLNCTYLKKGERFFIKWKCLLLQLFGALEYVSHCLPSFKLLDAPLIDIVKEGTNKDFTPTDIYYLSSEQLSKLYISIKLSFAKYLVEKNLKIFWNEKQKGIKINNIEFYVLIQF